LKTQGGSQREIFSKYVICNADGQRLLVLEDFNIVDWIQWSPDNKKIIIQERGDRGFKIIYLDYISENNIVIKNVYHFPGFPKFERQTSTFCQSPKWSPDGNKILFITSAENDHSVLYDNIYILEDSSYNYYPINESQDSFIFKVDWISNRSIFMDSRNKITKEDFTHEITIE
jgi:Tol biopolymer transport system component